MADLGTLITIASNVFQLLQSPVLQGMASWKSDLQNLDKTVSSIKSMLLDADRKPVLSNTEKDWIERVEDVLYDADDLFDEVVTRATQKQLANEGAKLPRKLVKKVGRFFSSSNSLLLSYNTSQEIQSVRQKLADIDRDHNGCDFKVDFEATRKRPLETCPFLHPSEKIIGRDDDVKSILHMLRDSNDADNVGFVVVVGIGGLGKTVLAQLVFNHQTIKYDKMLWVCVADQDDQHFDVQLILQKILQSLNVTIVASTMVWLQRELHQQLENSKYLLVLDDVWTHDPHEWRELRKYLMVGAKGSKILITTRSEETADVVLRRRDHPNKYMLQGLCDKDALRLFQLTAFEGSEDAENLELDEIGKKILKKCCNLPLAIKVVGTLLHSLPTNEWKSFEESRLNEIKSSKKRIMSILKLSYDNLQPSLKSCFSYCALFPKDYEFRKDELINFWIAQGYIMSSKSGQRIEDVAGDHFLILLKRCFFQCNYFGEVARIRSFKIHDLLHDLAQEIMGDKICVMNARTNILGEKVRHLFLGKGCPPSQKAVSLPLQRMEVWMNQRSERCISKSKIRSSIIRGKIYSNEVKTMINNWSCIRTLSLWLGECESLPDSIGDLLHLRYLDLSFSQRLKRLPSTITKLCNLQTLILFRCDDLKEWPKGFDKLVNLRNMDLYGCGCMCMPPGIEKLTNLQVLTQFVVDLGSNVKSAVEQLKELKALTKLRGCLSIKFIGNFSGVDEGWVRSCLESTVNLEEVGIDFGMCSGGNECEPLLGNLLPPRNLKMLKLFGYKGEEIPRWGRPQDDWALLLPNLVHLHFRECRRLRHLPSLSKLMHLKSLSIWDLELLEYLEEDGSNIASTSTAASFFPSLQKLEIIGASSMKGWWRPTISGGQNGQPSFPLLSDLSIKGCRSLTSFPACPMLVSIQLVNINSELGLRDIVENPSFSRDTLLKEIIVDSVRYLKALSTPHLRCCKLEDLQEKKIDEIEEALKTCSSTLERLYFWNCKELRSLPSRGLEHLIALEYLEIKNCPKLRLSEEESDSGMPWRPLHRNLRSLMLSGLDSVEFLPSGMKFLTSLQQLTVYECSNMKALPEWITCLSSLNSLTIKGCTNMKSLPEGFQHLTSLRSLQIFGCPDLADACQELSGNDWPKIKHIPNVCISAEGRDTILMEAQTEARMLVPRFLKQRGKRWSGMSLPR